MIARANLIQSTNLGDQLIKKEEKIETLENKLKEALADLKDKNQRERNHRKEKTSWERDIWKLKEEQWKAQMEIDDLRQRPRKGSVAQSSKAPCMRVLNQNITRRELRSPYNAPLLSTK